MPKLVFNIILITISSFFSLSSVSMAESVFDFGSKKNDDSQKQQQDTNPPLVVMTPDQFNSKVDTLNQETTKNLTQELKDDVAKVQQSSPSVEGLGSPSTNAPPPSSSSNQNNSSTQNSFNAAGTPTPSETPPPVSNAQGATPQQQVYPSQPQPAPNYNSQPSSYGPPQQVAPPPGQQPYSGFGTGNTGTGTSTTNPSSGSSGGFNIKY